MGRIHFNLNNSATLGGMAPAPLAGGGFGVAAIPGGMAGAGVYIILNANVVPHNRYVGIAGGGGGIAGRFAQRLPTITEMGFAVATMNNIGVTWGTVNFHQSPHVNDMQAAAAVVAAAQALVNAGGAVGVPMGGGIAFVGMQGAATAAGLGAVPATRVAAVLHGGLPGGFAAPAAYAAPAAPTAAQLLAAAAAPANLRPAVVVAALDAGRPIANVAALVNHIGALGIGVPAALAATALERAQTMAVGVAAPAVPAPPAAFQAMIDGANVNFERLLIRFVISQLLGPAAPPGTVSNNVYAGGTYTNPTPNAIAVTLTWGALPGGYLAGNLTRIWRTGGGNAW